MISRLSDAKPRGSKKSRNLHRLKLKRGPSPHDSVVLPMMKLQRTFSDDDRIDDQSESGPPPYFVKRGRPMVSPEISRSSSPRFDRRGNAKGKARGRPRSEKRKSNNPFARNLDRKR